MGWMGEQVELCIQPCCTGSAVRYLIVLESILQSNPIVFRPLCSTVGVEEVGIALTLQAKDKRLREIQKE
jgi:hypothetical protein